jgi:hypothetical protein
MSTGLQAVEVHEAALPFSLGSPELAGAVQGIGAVALLPIAGSLGSGAWGGALSNAPALAALVVVPVLLTAPALLIGHAFLGNKANAWSLVRAMAVGATAMGTLALGLTPIVIFFALTTPGGEVASAAALVGSLGCGLRRSWKLMRAEMPARAQGLPWFTHALLVDCWAILTGLIGLRVASYLTPWFGFGGAL